MCEGSSGINSHEEGRRDTTPKQYQQPREQQPQLNAAHADVGDEMDVVEIPPDVSLDGHPVRTAAAGSRSTDGKRSSTKDQVSSAPAAAFAGEGSPPLVRFGMFCRERMSSVAVSHAVRAKRAFELGLSSSTSSLESFEESRVDRLTRVPARGHPTGHRTASQTPSSSLKHRHPLDTLRKRGVGSGYGTAEGGEDAAATVAKLRVLLRREKEAKARERERKEMAEEQAKMACASLESESKRWVYST